MHRAKWFGTLDKTRKVIILWKKSEAVLQFFYFDPVTESEKTMPSGLSVHLMDDTLGFDRTIESVTTDKDGIAYFGKHKWAGVELYIQLDFAQHEFIDLEKNEFVNASEVKGGELRKLIRMPDKWSLLDQTSLFDDRGGRVKEGKIVDIKDGELGTASDPWKIVVDYNWKKHYGAFKFYNVHNKAEAGAYPCGLLVEAYDEDWLKDPLVGAGTVLNQEGLFYVPIFDPKCDLDEIYFMAKGQKDFWIKVDQGKTVNLTEAAYNALSVQDKQMHYPLPELWSSKNQRAKLGGRIKEYEEFVKDGNLTTSKSDPLIFHLDDFALVDERMNVLSWNTNNRVSIFDHLLAIRNPEPKEPYLSKNQPIVQKNLFPAPDYGYVAGAGPEKSTRAVRLEDGFFDLTYKRTKTGDLIGIRAAVKNDHPYKDIQGPYISYCGNYSLHYFHDCHHDSAGDPLGHILVYWCAYFKPEAGVTAGDIENYKQHGTINTKIRHEGQHPADPSRTTGHKNYVIKPYVFPGGAAPSPNRNIKVCFHIAARDTGPYHCKVNVNAGGPDNRDNMGLTEANFDKINYESKNWIKATDQADGFRYEGFTMAHEIGHALGLGDEYIEGLSVPGFASLSAVDQDFVLRVIWDKTILSKHDLPAHMILPYAVEEDRSLMYGNTVPRMRHFWPYADWLNQDAKVQQLLGGQKYCIEYPINTCPRPPAARALAYYLDSPYRDYSKPFRVENNVLNGKTGKLDLALYKTGQDETQLYNVRKNFEGFDSILVVRIKLHYSFVPNIKNIRINDWKDRIKLLRDFQTAVNDFVGQKTDTSPVYTLEGRVGDFKKCLVYFLPHYDVSNTAPAGSHKKLELRPKTGTPANDISDIDMFDAAHISSLASPPSDTIKIVDSTNLKSLFRYSLGLPAVQTTGTTTTPIQTIVPADLDFLADWMEGELGSIWPGITYTAHRY